MIHAQTVGHLVRRGLELTTMQDPSTPHDPENRPPWEQIRMELPLSVAIPVFFTILIFIVVLVSVRYTLMGVVATLAQVETPTSEYLALNRKDDDPTDESDPAPPYSDTDALNGHPSSNADPETSLVSQKPITSSIRGTIRHIVTIGGFTARWRGLAAAACTQLAHGIVYQIILNLFIQFMPATLSSIIAGLITTVIFARWYMAWTHIVISDPGLKVWYRRVPSFKTWKNIWAPTAINALAAQVALLAPMYVFLALGLGKQENIEKGSLISAVWKLFLVLFVALVVYLAVVLPSQVALTRCQASMLPEEDESIVPFDRSFGGKVTPAIVGGSGMLSFIDALKSFDRPSMIRLVKLYAKIFAIDMAMHLLFGLVLTLEFVVLLGPAVKRAFITSPSA